LLFTNFSSFKLDTKNNVNFDAVSSKCADFDEVHFYKHIPKPIVISTHNLHTLLLLMRFCLFNIRPKLHHRKWRKLRVTLFRTVSTSPAACWCCCSSNLQAIWKLCYKLPRTLYNHTDFWSKFCILCWMAPCWRAVWHLIFKNLCYFQWPVWKTKKAKANEMYKLYSILLNISAKCHQNRSL